MEMCFCAQSVYVLPHKVWVPRNSSLDFQGEVSGQRVLSEILGKPVMLNEYDKDGRAELEFKDRDDVIHFIYVDPKFIEAAPR